MNMCNFDRGLRIIGSALLIYIGFFNTGLIGNMVINVLLGGFGLLNLVSAIAGFCPVYHCANLSTYRDQLPNQH